MTSGITRPLDLALAWAESGSAPTDARVLAEEVRAMHVYVNALESQRERRWVVDERAVGIRELAQLRARIDAVVQEWRDAPDDVEPRSGVRSAWPELGAALDALMVAEAHDCWKEGLMPPIPAPCCGCNCTACHSGNCCKKD